LDGGREEKSPTGFGLQDQGVLPFRTTSLGLRGAGQTRAEVLHDLTNVANSLGSALIFIPHSD
jgi:hypothetical protein